MTTSVPNTSKIGVWRIEPDGHYALKGLMDDPIVTAAAEQASRNDGRTLRVAAAVAGVDELEAARRQADHRPGLPVRSARLLP